MQHVSKISSLNKDKMQHKENLNWHDKKNSDQNQRGNCSHSCSRHILQYLKKEKEKKKISTMGKAMAMAMAMGNGNDGRQWQWLSWWQWQWQWPQWYVLYATALCSKNCSHLFQPQQLKNYMLLIARQWTMGFDWSTMAKDDAGKMYEVHGLGGIQQPRKNAANENMSFSHTINVYLLHHQQRLM